MVEVWELAKAVLLVAIGVVGFLLGIGLMRSLEE